ncbi:MAG: beta-lactamase family protein [Alphaproteobacteria bacterium]|nr:beta-lactamase family protein [Alphaproteobacteria bacterium]MBU1513152.1 beta-lactamase family protein [Alphaproteobacteria bacterium]MBU2095260.1 beta-lactamase family protein [Alphaproteobacteria bacterium]MBU2152175.1 beta-lactamase family protein [Alphaproteobacteria bacterium]MBU2306778.1 beta-lactamase family protein [Alphaproteobacteria bacterium]
MTMISLDRRGLLLGGAGLMTFAALPALARIAVQAPASAGFTAAGVADLNAQMHALVDQQKLAGVVTLLARKGKIVNLDAYGKQDASGAAPMAIDSIFRIASMTKPVTGVAMMQLWEQGKWKLDDPVSKHIPEFAGLKVKTAGGLVDQAKPMTMAQLMSHTAGFGTSGVYDAAQINLRETDLQGMVDKLSKLPLESQPGTDWAYGPCVDLQGYVVQKLSGKSLDRYFQDHILTPLKMPDTQFWVDPAKTARVVRIHTYDPAGKIVATDSRLVTSPPRFLAGGGGLYSTAPDYYRFCQALLQGGELEGARILKPDTVKLMRKSVLEPGVGVDLYGPVQKGLGFGMDFATHDRPAESGLPQGQDSYWWGGAFGTWFWIDPTNDVVFVGMIQNVRGSVPGAGTPDVRAISPKAVYAALTDKKA